MKIKLNIKWVFAALFLFALAALAQVSTNMPPVPAGATAAQQAQLVTLWNGLVVLLVPVIVASIKKWIPNVPKVSWPLLATVLGAGADWLLGKSGALAHSSWAMGALCGAAGVGLREATMQVAALAGVGVGADPVPNPAEKIQPPPAAKV